MHLVDTLRIPSSVSLTKYSLCKFTHSHDMGREDRSNCRRFLGARNDLLEKRLGPLELLHRIDTFDSLHGLDFGSIRGALQETMSEYGIDGGNDKRSHLNGQGSSGEKSRLVLLVDTEGDCALTKAIVDDIKGLEKVEYEDDGATGIGAPLTRLYSRLSSEGILARFSTSTMNLLGMIPPADLDPSRLMEERGTAARTLAPRREWRRVA